MAPSIAVADATRAAISPTRMPRTGPPSSQAALMSPEELPKIDQAGLHVPDAVRAEMPDLKKLGFAPQQLMKLTKPGKLMLEEVMKAFRHAGDNVPLHRPNLLGSHVAREMRGALALEKKTLSAIPDNDVEIIGDALAARRFGFNLPGTSTAGSAKSAQTRVGKHEADVLKNYSQQFQAGYRFQREQQAAITVGNRAQANAARQRNLGFKSDDTGEIVDEVPNTLYGFYDLPKPRK